jgi:hypothetical protein
MGVLQNCMDLVTFEPDSYSGTCHVRNWIISMEVQVTDTQEKENPVLTTFPLIKAVHEVSYMVVCKLLGSFFWISRNLDIRYLELPVTFLASTCCLHITQSDSNEWILKNPHINRRTVDEDI